MGFRRRHEVRRYTPEEWEAEQTKFGAQEKTPGLKRVRQGPWQDAEDFADEMIRQSLKDVKAYSAKSDILTPWKIYMREQREVFVASGTPDPAIRLGMYRRAANPDHPELNCLGFDTEVLVRDEGLVPIGDLEGSVVQLYTSAGWGKGKIQYFGIKMLHELKLRRNDETERTILATADHRWFVPRSPGRPSKVRPDRIAKNGHIERYTGELVPGQRLISKPPEGTIGPEWKVVSVEEHGMAPAYCAIVPETEDFVLADDLLTGNSRMGVAGARTRGASRSLGAVSAYSGQDESGESDNVLDQE
jgi:hypothetical protein